MLISSTALLNRVKVTWESEIFYRLDDFREELSASFQAGHFSCLNIQRGMEELMEEGLEKFPRCEQLVIQYSV